MLVTKNLRDFLVHRNKFIKSPGLFLNPQKFFNQIKKRFNFFKLFMIKNTNIKSRVGFEFLYPFMIFQTGIHSKIINQNFFPTLSYKINTLFRKTDAIQLDYKHVFKTAANFKSQELEKFIKFSNREQILNKILNNTAQQNPALTQDGERVFKLQNPPATTKESKNVHTNRRFNELYLEYTHGISSIFSKLESKAADAGLTDNIRATPTNFSSPAAVQTASEKTSITTPMDIGRMADQVYRLIEKKIQLENERLGKWY